MCIHDVYTWRNSDPRQTTHNPPTHAIRHSFLPLPPSKREFKLFRCMCVCICGIRLIWQQNGNIILNQIRVESRLPCALPSSTEVPVLLLNQPIMRTPSFHNYLWVAGNQGKSITRVILQHNIWKQVWKLL